MNDSSINALANRMNISPSVVSRVLRHCGGVDSETRHRILEAAEGIREPKTNSCDVYAIFPDIPHFFWTPIRRGVADTLESQGISIKSSLCTKVTDETAILRYLNEQECRDAKVLIIAARITPAMEASLRESADSRLVLFLSEYCNLKNTFYCGSDAFQDGFRMGQIYAERYADRALILMEIPADVNAEFRIDGFLRAVSERNAGASANVVRVTVDRKSISNFKLASSKLAPLLVNAAGTHDRLAIYVPSGIPQVPLAISKADLADRTVLLCHDRAATEKCLVETVSCNQNPLEQGKTAARLATEYILTRLCPKEKRTFTSSEIRISAEHKK